MSLTLIERRIAVLSRNPRLNPDFCFLIGFADREKITMAIRSSMLASGIRRNASNFPRLKLICRTHFRPTCSLKSIPDVLAEVPSRQI